MVSSSACVTYMMRERSWLNADSGRRLEGQLWISKVKCLIFIDEISLMTVMHSGDRRPLVLSEHAFDGHGNGRDKIELVLRRNAEHSQCTQCPT